jgi:hypothetical protein
MMPCKFCGPFDSAGAPRLGIKQVGKTETVGTYFLRTYKCKECSATLLMTGNTASRVAAEKWVRPEVFTERCRDTAHRPRDRAAG